MAMSRQQKKWLIFLGIAVVLYLCCAVFGFTRDDGAMGPAMQRARKLVADTRRDIQKEMDKPFILRLFGSLFGMENNSFQRMQEELPKIFAEAMPDTLSDASKASEPEGPACEGMRLHDALAYLQEQGYTLDSLHWRFDDTEHDHYIALPGQVLAVEETVPGAASLVLQMRHEFTGEDGIGTDPGTKRESRTALTAQLAAERDSSLTLGDWLAGLTSEQRRDLGRQGVPLQRWAALTVTYEPSTPAALP